MRIVTSATARCNILNLYSETKWQPINARRNNAKLIMMFKIQNNQAPPYLTSFIPEENEQRNRYNLCNIHNLPIPTVRLESFKRSFIPGTINIWNELPLEIRQKQTLDEFRFHLKSSKDDPNILFY